MNISDRHSPAPCRLYQPRSQKRTLTQQSRVSAAAHYAVGSLALWPEHLLAVNLVVRDCVLALVRNEPVDELLAKLLLHMRMLGRVHQYDAVLVEQPLIALHCDDEVGFVLK